MNGLDLLVEVERLQLVDMCLAPTIGISVVAMHSHLLSSSLLFFGYGLTSNCVENIGTCASQTLEVVGNVHR